MAGDKARRGHRDPVADEALGNVTKSVAAEEMRARARRRLAAEQQSPDRAARIRAVLGKNS